MRSRFDRQNLSQFWDVVSERHKIWHRRNIEKKSRPWTQDAILSSYRFTNVYRELDPGTKYAKRIIKKAEGLQETIFNLILYRLIGRKETHQFIGIRSLNDTKEEIENALRERESKGTVFTAAYTVCAYHWYGGKDKIENVAYLCQDMQYALETLQLAVVSSMKEAYQKLRQIPGLGKFLSYQVLVDATYYVNGSQVLDLDQNEWARAGPGAERGLKYLGITSFRVEAMKELHRMHESALDQRDFPWLQEDGNVMLKLSDIQNCLCEYSKYKKTIDGDGRPRRTYP